MPTQTKAIYRELEVLDFIHVHKQKLKILFINDTYPQN
jgi:hypothetical protein